MRSLFLKLISLVGLVCVLALHSTPGFAQERQWNLDAADNQVFLVFGVPDTDDVGLSFWCKVKTADVSVYLPVQLPNLRTNEKVSMTITVDGRSEILPAQASRDAATDRMTVEAKFKTKSQLMGRLAAGQSVTVTVKGHASIYPLQDADFAGLVNACTGVDSN